MKKIPTDLPFAAHSIHHSKQRFWATGCGLQARPDCHLQSR